MLKRLLKTMSLLLFLQPVIAQQKTVTLTGNLVNFSSQVLVEDLSEYQYLKPQSADHLIIPAADGSFSISFPLSEPNYFRVGRNILYLSPGDRLTVNINYNNARLGTFEGMGAEANTYLTDTAFPKAGSFLEAGKNLLPSAGDTYNVLIQQSLERSKKLATLLKVSPEFRRLEEARVKADVLNSFAAVKTYLQITKKTTQPDTFLTAFNRLSAAMKADYSRNFVDPSLMKLVVYRDIADGLAAETPTAKGAAAIKDWYRAYSTVKRMESENDKSRITAMKTSIDSILTPGFRKAATEYYNTLISFGKGDPAVDFKALTMEGKTVSLSDLRGKVIYVDLWATWCGPCLAEMPRYEELKGRFKDNPDVVFVSLSIDDDGAVDKWRQNVEVRKAGGYQWQVNRNKLHAYNIVGIPRTLLIDKNFRIVNMNGPLPSAKNAEETIRKLLQ